MIRRAPVHPVLAVLLVCLYLPPATASDDDTEPLYVVHDGQRLPTVIIPPKASGASATRSGGLQVVGWPLGPRDATADAETLEPLDPLDDDEWVDLTPRRYEVDYYAGYPVTRYHRDPVYWRTHDPYLRPGYGRALRDEYRARRYIADRERGHRFNVRDMKRRKARILNNHEKALRLGLEHMKLGDYGQAVVALTMAGELNQGDPACRIHLAQARLAQGHYEDAGKVLRRALQLQPKLRFLSLSLPSYYPDHREFDQHVDKLAAWVRQNRAGANTYFLLGYLEFQRDNHEQAYAAFGVARRGFPKDSLTESYLEITRPPAR